MPEPEKLRKHAPGVPPGKRLLPTGKRLYQPQFAVALSLDGTGLVQLGSLRAKRNTSQELRGGRTRHGRCQPSQKAILVVEDEQLLRLFAVDIVEEAGFLALQADNADEAVAILEARSDIALLITDINMPGSMNGVKLAHAVRTRWPPVKIIVVSGQVHAWEHDLPSGSRFFSKPYQAETLISEIHSLVGS